MINKIAVDTMMITSLFFQKKDQDASTGTPLLVLSLYFGSGTIGDGFGRILGEGGVIGFSGQIGLMSGVGLSGLTGGVIGFTGIGVFGSG